MKLLEINFYKDNFCNNCLVSNDNSHDERKFLYFTSKITENDAFDKEAESLHHNRSKSGYIFGGAAGIASVFAFIKPVKNKIAAIQIQRLIKKLKPQDVDFAKKIYPVLIKYSKILNIAPEHFNKIVSAINKENREFIAGEGIELIANKFEKLERITETPHEDFKSLVASLKPQNKEVFKNVADNIERLEIHDIDDFQLYLDELNPEKNDYVFGTLLDLLNKYKKELKLNHPKSYINLFNEITPETEGAISQISEFQFIEGKKLDRYGILRQINPENKDCLLPLLQNSDSYSSSEIKNLLQIFKNDNAPYIDILAKNIKPIQALKIDYKQIAEILKDKNNSKILDFLIQNYKALKIESYEDIVFYMKQINPEKFDFISQKIMPKLEPNVEIFGLTTPDEIADLFKNITPETLSGIEIVSEYAKVYGETLSYQSLLMALTKDNISKLPELMKNIQKTEVWDNFMVNSADFKKLLE